MDTELNLAVPPVDTVDVQSFYMPDFKAVQPVDDNTAAKIAFNLDYKGWVVHHGWDGVGDTIQEIPAGGNQIPDTEPADGFWKSWQDGFARENSINNLMEYNARGTY